MRLARDSAVGHEETDMRSMLMSTLTMADTRLKRAPNN